MRNSLIWVGVMIALIVIAGKIPKTTPEWLIIDTGAILFWCLAGMLLALRFVVRFVKH